MFGAGPCYNAPEMFAVSLGAGPPVVLLHAFPLSGAMWRPQLGALSHAARVIAPDLPGFGRSPRLPVPSITGMAHAIAAQLPGGATSDNIDRVVTLHSQRVS